MEYSCVRCKWPKKGSCKRVGSNMARRDGNLRSRSRSVQWKDALESNAERMVDVVDRNEGQPYQTWLQRANSCMQFSKTLCCSGYFGHKVLVTGFDRHELACEEDMVPSDHIPQRPLSLDVGAHLCIFSLLSPCRFPRTPRLSVFLLFAVEVHHLYVHAELSFLSIFAITRGDGSSCYISSAQDIRHTVCA